MSARGRRGRPPGSADRRDDILQAALVCFVERGFHGTAVPQVAKQAGIAAGTIYHYFPSKEALVNALYRHCKMQVAARVLGGFPGGAPVREQFEAMWREMVDFARSNATAFAFLEFHNHASYLDAESLAMENGLKDFGAAIVKRAQDEGHVKPGPTMLVMELVFGAFIGMIRAHADGRLELTPAAQALAEQACWDAIAVHPV